MKRFSKVLVAMLIAALLVPSMAMAADINVVFVPKLTGNAFFESANDGAQKYAAEQGFTVTYDGNPEASVANQVAVIQNAINSGADAICVSSVDATGLDDIMKEAMAAGLNGPDAEGKNLKINLVLTDLKESYVLWIENAVLHFKRAEPAPDANATLALTKDIFVKMIAGTAGVKDTLMSDDLKVTGSKIDLVRFFGLIDKAPGTFPIVTK